MNKKALFVLPLLLLSLLWATVGFADGAMLVVRIQTEPQQLLQPLYDHYDVWDHGSHGEPYVLARVAADQVDVIRAMGFDVTIDLAQTLAAQRTSQPSPEQLSGIPGFACYRTVEESFSTLDGLALAHPDLVRLEDIGDSWQKTQGAGGYDMRLAVLSNQAVGGDKPKFMLMAATHAREYATAETALRFAEHLLTNYGVDPDVTWMLDHFELHLLPQANPDGRKISEAADIWQRKNANTNACGAGALGVDLNRNMSFKWGFPGASSSSCSETYRGPSAVSEPENAAITAYIDALYPDLRGPNDSDAASSTVDGVFVTVHSYGEVILPVWGWTTATAAPNADALFTLGRKMGYYSDYSVCGTGSCIGAASGTHDDYAYGQLGVPAYTYEMGTTFHQSCTSFENSVYPDTFGALLYTFKATRLPYQTPAGPEATELQSAAGGSRSVITVSLGTPVQLLATVDDTRYDSNGFGFEPTQPISAARYSVDLPSWKATTTVPMAAADGAFNQTAEVVSATIATSTWSVGRHIIFVEGQDSDGNWGVPSAIFVDVVQQPTAVTLERADAAPNSSSLLLALLALLLLAGLPLALHRRAIGSPERGQSLSG